MHRDYKPAPPKPEKKSNPFLNGLLVGLLVGVAIAVAFTVYIKGGASHSQQKMNLQQPLNLQHLLISKMMRMRMQTPKIALSFTTSCQAMNQK